MIRKIENCKDKKLKKYECNINYCYAMEGKSLPQLVYDMHWDNSPITIYEEILKRIKNPDTDVNEIYHDMTALLWSTAIVDLLPFNFNLITIFNSNLIDEISLLLIDRPKIDLNKQNKIEGVSALMYTIFRGNIKIFDKILQKI